MDGEVRVQWRQLRFMFERRVAAICVALFLMAGLLAIIAFQFLDLRGILLFIIACMLVLLAMSIGIVCSQQASYASRFRSERDEYRPKHIRTK